MIFAHVLVIASVLISLVGSFAYVVDTIKGKSKPNRISWAMWASAPLVATIIALYSHADIWTTTRTFMAGFVPLTILIASFISSKSYWKLTFFDFICGALSVLALIIWLLAGSPEIAILFAVAGDAFALIPTLAKAWKYPETETGITFVAGLTASVLVLPLTPIWNIENSAFQIYLLVANTLLIGFIYKKYFLRIFTAIKNKV